MNDLVKNRDFNVSSRIAVSSPRCAPLGAGDALYAPTPSTKIHLSLNGHVD